MNPDRQQAIEYLRSPGTPWHWAENGAVIVWNDGTTIAFREEIIRVLETLAPRGLPPFGAVVFLLAATREKVPTVGELVAEASQLLPPSNAYKPVVLAQARHRLSLRLQSSLDRLANISSLPKDLRSGVRARCLLAEVVFEAAECGPVSHAETILRELQSPFTDTELNNPALEPPGGNRIRQVQLVSERLQQLTIESLRLRMETGLDALPGDADATLPTAERARRLIDELSRDREFGEVGRAARELIAAVRLPRRIDRKEQLAIGGVADLTNRGPLDRLLLSELAHDDLTLATRVALNEALYIQREPPMREPPGALAILLDSGVRLWGIPRVLATAVALALIARDKTDPTVIAWRASHGRIEPVDLLSRRGLVTHLHALETDAHPGDALPLFVTAAASAENGQTIVVTHRDTLDDPEFRKALTKPGSIPNYIATVDREGQFELHGLPLSSRPPLCQATVDLKRIFPPDAGPPPMAPKLNPDLPWILSLRPFPFLLPVAGTPDIWIQGPGGLQYVVLNDRRLVRYQDPRKGAQELARDLPPGKSAWMDSFEQCVYIVKSGGSNRPVRLISYSIENDQLNVTSLTGGDKLQAVVRQGGTLILIQTDELLAFSLRDGQPLDRFSYQKGYQGSKVYWNHGRYYRNATGFFAVTWDGRSLGLKPVTLPSSIPNPADVVKLFDRRGCEGPWALLHSGQIVSTATGESPIKMLADQPLDFSKAKVSRHGDQVFIPKAPVPPFEFSPGHLVSIPENLEGAKSEFLQSPQRSFDPPPAFPTRNLYRVVEAIAFTPKGPLFVGRKGYRRQIILDLHPHKLIRIVPFTGINTASREAVTFQPAIETNRGCHVQRAEWTSGSRVFLDSRGLLHFKSHDTSLPEVSLVLCDGEVAGWTSDGHVCGPAFFFEHEHQSEPEAVFDRLMQFMKRL